jgi:predicted dehydrogenase
MCLSGLAPSVSLGYPNGVVGHIHVSWADPNKVREIVVVGSEKRIVFDDLNVLERVKIYEKGVTPAPPEADSYGEFQFTMRDGDIISPRVEVNEPLKTQCAHFLECVRQNVAPFTDGQAGLEVVQVMEAIDHSLQHNGMPVTVWPRPTLVSTQFNGTSGIDAGNRNVDTRPLQGQTNGVSLRTYKND